jgi:hypothetical protein
LALAVRSLRCGEGVAAVETLSTALLGADDGAAPGQWLTTNSAHGGSWSGRPHQAAVFRGRGVLGFGALGPLQEVAAQHPGGFPFVGIEVAGDDGAR